MTDYKKSALGDVERMAEIRCEFLLEVNSRLDERMLSEIGAAKLTER